MTETPELTCGLGGDRLRTPITVNFFLNILCQPVLTGVTDILLLGEIGNLPTEVFFDVGDDFLFLTVNVRGEAVIVVP